VVLHYDRPTPIIDVLFGEFDADKTPPLLRRGRTLDEDCRLGEGKRRNIFRVLKFDVSERIASPIPVQAWPV